METIINFYIKKYLNTYLINKVSFGRLRFIFRIDTSIAVGGRRVHGFREVNVEIVSWMTQGIWVGKTCLHLC